jgi:hypothetical protein
MTVTLLGFKGINVLSFKNITLIGQAVGHNVGFSKYPFCYKGKDFMAIIRFLPHSCSRD